MTRHYHYHLDILCNLECPEPVQCSLLFFLVSCPLNREYKEENRRIAYTPLPSVQQYVDVNSYLSSPPQIPLCLAALSLHCVLPIVHRTALYTE